MMNIDRYKHLNSEDRVPFSIEETVKRVDYLNYGSQRFLSALVKLREKSDDYVKYDDYRKHTQQLRELLENGWY
jgi:hypothetical protein